MYDQVTYTPIANGMLILSGECGCCGKEQQMKVNAANFYDWKRGSRLIQQAFPDLHCGDREWLISGICSKCFDKLFNSLEKETFHE